MSDKIECQLCKSKEHSIRTHLAKAHPGVTLEEYKSKFSDAPLLSEVAKDLIKKKQAEKAAAAPADETKVEMSGTAASVTTLMPKGAIVKRPLHEVFDLGKATAAMSSRGEPIPISVLTPHSHQNMVPEISDNYVYDIDELKNVILAQELNIPCLVWGHKGSGKSELLEQVSARTNRPSLRIQHTVNTEESHILGQWTVKGGETKFELGPLPVAMMNGWTYCADEYDFGMPSVLAVYQPVLEGKALVIKEAPEELRVIKPHKDFRFVATGNTNGSGDETGLYQGTLIQNSANYDRFGMVINKKYMDKKAESQILQNHCKLTPADAEKMVEFASLVRVAYDGAKMSDTISPRTLIYASRIGVMRGSFRQGLNLSFISKLTSLDRQVAEGLSQRVFGS
ncbi:MoxR family ATPase [Undibacterium sp. RTI2.1]|uniref:MoxR family ATPase n=1 Tax=unclassified Undibacterium TaxID=2630295 RepID=UPI002B22A523|nr:MULTISPECIES: MoxR family ATPase [unclassified Undibacterium]MEB0029122.1 MoxR family ATPase [Undibacterium sp. RTI2.1]MEB0115430.1 MoxR family ATPase [Undibacterium sp. RTI2.2]